MNPLDVLKKVLRNRSALLLAGLVVAAVGVYLWAAWEPDIRAPATARAPGVQPVESIPGGPQTPEYDRLQQMADHRRADRALAIGGSAAPTPPRLEPRTAEAPASAGAAPVATPPAAAPAPVPAAPPPEDSAARANAFARAMREQMQGLLAYRERFAPKPTRMVAFEDLPGQRERAEQRKPAELFGVEGRVERPRDRRGLLAPGDILHAVLQTAINSDEPGPVRAKVVGERFKGAVLLGELGRFPPVVGSRPERVLVKFTDLTTPDRGTYPIDAYAIDLETARTALATGVDHHILERWGSLVAASFLEGYGQAVQASHSITTVGPLGNVVSVPKDDFDHEDIVRAAVGTVGERLGHAVAEHFRRPNTITVQAGTGIGVLIVAPTTREGSPEEASGGATQTAAVSAARSIPVLAPRPPVRASASAAGIATGLSAGSAPPPSASPAGLATE